MSAILNMLLATGRPILYSGTLTPGLYSSTPVVAYGYFGGAGAGTLSPTTFSSSPTLTISLVNDQIVGGSLYTSYIRISGFSTDPGYQFLYSLQWGSGTENVYSGGTTDYVYTGGTPNYATWTFYKTASPNFGFQAGSGSPQTLVLRA